MIYWCIDAGTNIGYGIDILYQLQQQLPKNYKYEGVQNKFQKHIVIMNVN